MLITMREDFKEIIWQIRETSSVQTETVNNINSPEQQIDTQCLKTHFHVTSCSFNEIKKLHGSESIRNS